MYMWVHKYNVSFIKYAVVTSFLKHFNEFLCLNYKKGKCFLKIFLAQQNYIINDMLSKLWIEYFRALRRTSVILIREIPTLVLQIEA